MKIRINLGGQTLTLPVPQGMDPGEYANQVEQSHAGQEKYNAARDDGFGGDAENFAAGMGRGAVNMGRQAVNMALPDQITPDFASDKSIEEAQVRDEDLLDTKAGTVGDMIGSAVATAPIGAGIGALAKGAGTASSAGRMLTRTLASPAGRAALDNAAVGALAAGPDDRLSGAAKGAAISGVMSGAGKVLKRTLMKPWVQKTQAALNTEAHTGHSIPLSQSAEPGLVKQIYEGVVANMPGSADKVRGQYADAVRDATHFAVEEALPPGANRIPALDGKDMQKVYKELSDVWEARYKSHDYVNAPVVMFSHLYNPPVGDVAKELKRLMPFGYKLPKMDATVTGMDIRNAQKGIQKAIDRLDPGDDILRSKFVDVKDNLDHVLTKNINPSGKGKSQWANELRDVEALKPYYRKFKDIETAVKKAPHASEFSLANLESATNSRAGQAGLKGEAPYSEFTRDSVEALRPFPSRQGIFQTRAAMAAGAGTVGAAIGGAAAGPVGAVIGAAAPVAISRMLANPTTQRVLTGETAKQKMLAAGLRKHKKAITTGADAIRKQIVLGATEDGR